MSIMTKSWILSFLLTCILERIVGLNDLSLCFQFLSQNKKQIYMFCVCEYFGSVPSKTEVL